MTTKVQGDMYDIDGATVATVAAGDKINFLDITDSLVKEDTVQGILDLAGGGAWNLIATDVGDSSGNLEVTGLSATYDTYAIARSDVVGASDAQHGYFRLGDSGGYDSGASDYSFIAQGTIASSGSYTGDTANANQAQMKLTMVSAQSIGNATGEGIGGLFYLHTPSDGSTLPLLSGTVSYTGNGGVLGTVAFGGRRESSITVDRVTFLFASGNVASGRMTVWGSAHA